MTSNLNQLTSQVNSILFGHEEKVEVALLSVLCEGHLLIEDMPGVGKTTLALTISKLLDLTYKRVQFTNDLLPTDILGGLIFKRKEEEFVFNKGPIFTNILLADEINRAPGRTQSALLEVMQENKVSIEGVDYKVPRPFIVMATQNPSHHIGTFPLPESQRDRFFMGIHLGIPNREQELRVLKEPSSHQRVSNLNPILNGEELKSHKEQINEVAVADSIYEYILDIMNNLRTQHQEYSLSPRAAQALVLATKGKAYLNGRNYVIPEDVQSITPYVLGHRLEGNIGLKRGHEKINESLSQVSIR